MSNAADTGRFLVAHAGPAARPGRGRRDADRRLLVRWGHASCGGSAYGHSGAGEGYKTNVWVSSDGRRVVVLLLNGRMADQATGDLRAAQALDQLYCAA